MTRIPPGEGPTRRIDVVLFDRFELLDVFGPLELYGMLSETFQIVLLGPEAGPVASAQGPAALASVPYAGAPAPDIVLVPGGIGTRALVDDRSFGVEVAQRVEYEWHRDSTWDPFAARYGLAES